MADETAMLKKVKAWQGLVAIGVGLTVIAGSVGGLVTKIVLGPLSDKVDRQEILINELMTERTAALVIAGKIETALEDIKRRLARMEQLEEN